MTFLFEKVDAQISYDKYFKLKKQKTFIFYKNLLIILITTKRPNNQNLILPSFCKSVFFII